jgi:hypothetical protein
LGDFDISYGILDILKKYQSRNGGFSNSNQNLQPIDWQESWISAQIGMAYLLAGDVRTANDVGQFLLDVWDKQPCIDKKLYYCYNPNKDELILEAEQPSIAYILEKQEPRQCFWVPGLISAFLGQLYLTTKNVIYLDYAKKYQDFVQSCTPKQFEGIEVCKTGLGSAVMYEITKEQRYLDWSIKVGDYFVRTQREDGCWVDDRFNPSTVEKDIAITDQQALWLHYIVGSL